MTQRRAGLADHRLSCSIGPPPGPSDTSSVRFRNHCRYHYRWQSTARVNGEEALSSPPVARAGNGGSRLRDRAFGAQAPDRVRRPRDRLVQCTGPSASAEARRRRSRAALGALAWTAEPIRRHEADAIGAVAFGEPEIAARRSPRSKPVAMVDRVRGRDRSRQQPVFDATVASRDRCST